MCKEEANKLKDYIHFFLYFLSEEDNRTFSQYESPIIEEIVQYTDSKVIYVVTHSDKDNEEEDNEEFINKINQGINSLSEVSNKEMMKATKDNVVFVNFYNQKKKRHLEKKNFSRKFMIILLTLNFLKRLQIN
jgi:ureidoglycolate hydrolase